MEADNKEPQVGTTKQTELQQGDAGNISECAKGSAIVPTSFCLQQYSILSVIWTAAQKNRDPRGQLLA